MDNHYWLNLIFSLVDQDGITPLPKAVWPLAGRVRDAVLEIHQHRFAAAMELHFHSFGAE
ncbi:MAG: hypothetical protein J2P54_01225 [Bradyrhizobiaceae bacterium]|nr:hypothetical protein [Bradyrhizobiaceae bacterium]